MAATIHPDTLSFLRDLSQNNDKAWFEANQSRYKPIREAYEAFINEGLGRIKAVPGVTAKKAVYRIYRDVRFSNDKRPYKENFGAMLSPRGKAEDLEGLYLQVAPGDSFAGMGLYQPTRPQLASLRQEIDYNLDEFKSIVEGKAFKKHFTFVGDQLKTAPKGYAKDHPSIDYLRRTQFLAMLPLTEEEIMAPDLMDRLVILYQEIQPFLAFLRRATTSEPATAKT